MLLVKEAVYFDLLDVKDVANKRERRFHQDQHLHLVTESRVGVSHKLTAN